METTGSYTESIPSLIDAIDVHEIELPREQPEPGPSERVLPDAHFSPKNTRAKVSAQLVEEIKLR